MTRAAEIELGQAIPGELPAAGRTPGGSPAERREAIPRLVEAGVLKQFTVGERNRAFEAPELIDSFTALERRPASPDADTEMSPPARRVPYRPAS